MSDGCTICGGQDKHDKLFNDWRAAEDAASRLGRKWKEGEARIASLRAELAASQALAAALNDEHEEVERLAEEFARLLKLANSLSRYADGHELKGRWMAELKGLKGELAEFNRRPASDQG